MFQKRINSRYFFERNFFSTFVTVPILNNLLEIKIFMRKIAYLLVIIIAGLTIYSCTDLDDTPPEPMLIIKFKVDPAQDRLDNLGQVSNAVGSGNASQTPDINGLSSDYIELLPNDNTQLGEGQIIYQSPRTTAGGTSAIDFAQSKVVAENDTFLEIPLKSITPGDYKWIRSSISYQNFTAKVRYQNTDYVGQMMSFLGDNNYIENLTIGNYSFPVNGNKPQGYWAYGLSAITYSKEGQTLPNATNVPNPLWQTSPIPQGSSIITGQFSTPLNITGLETRNIIVTLSLSNKKSFIWREMLVDNKYQPTAGENIIDIGLRGLKATYIK
jgi:hypothetical protein